jgi:Uncharacterized proteins, LmbE homologs
MTVHQRVLVVAAHPDDEVLGCGALCAKLADGGAAVSVLILGEGATSRDQPPTGSSMDEAVRQLRQQAAQAAALLGVQPPLFGKFPDNRFDTVALLELIKCVEAAKAAVQPTLVLTHHAGDLNIDHVLTHRAVMTAFRPLPGEPARELLAFEVLSSTEYAASPGFSPFEPTVFVDVAEQLNRKIEALAAYTEEVHAAPHPRSEHAVRALAARRGSQAGLHNAEAFMLLRGVWR